RVDLGRRSPALSRRWTTGARAVGRVDPARRPRSVDLACAAWTARGSHGVSRAWTDRADGRVDRRDLRWPLRARTRRGLERNGISRLRFPVRPHRLTFRGAVRYRAAPPRRRARDARGRVSYRRRRGPVAT